MKKKSFLGYAGVILALVCILVFAGCKDSEPPEPDIRLVGSWTNDPDGNYTGDTAGLLKEFTINPDFSFEAKINVVFLTFVRIMGDTPAAATTKLGTPNEYVWTISGKLQIVEGELYMMTLTAAPTGKAYSDIAPGIVQAFVGDGLQVKLTVGTGQFEFDSADDNAQVKTFFGGNYYAVEQDP